jgi:hypothetical protein
VPLEMRERRTHTNGCKPRREQRIATIRSHAATTGEPRVLHDVIDIRMHGAEQALERHLEPWGVTLVELPKRALLAGKESANQLRVWRRSSLDWRAHIP